MGGGEDDVPNKNDYNVNCCVDFTKINRLSILFVSQGFKNLHKK